MEMSVESFVRVNFHRLDKLVRRLTTGKYWALWIGTMAVALSLLAHTPVRSMFRDVGTSWTAEVIRAQMAHPLTPIDFEKFEATEAAPRDPGAVSHIDKITFRISIPIIGKLLHTGAASFLVLNYVAGFLFFPMLAGLANRLFQDRVSATYVTFAFALSWAGSRFFNDDQLGDGFAWACLLATIYFRNPLLIFSAVLIAGFTDERAIAASPAAFLYWLSVATSDDQDDSRSQGRAALTAIGTAWLAYLVLRLSLSYAFGLRTGTAAMFQLAPVWNNAAHSIPYGLLTVLHGLWLWIAVGLIALYVSRRVTILLGFVATLACILTIALSVWDFQRSAGFAFLLLPVAWQARGLERGTVRTLARSCFVLGICLVVPFNTVFRYLYHGPILAVFG